jgi:hypothetical protein
MLLLLLVLLTACLHHQAQLRVQQHSQQGSTTPALLHCPLQHIATKAPVQCTHLPKHRGD